MRQIQVKANGFVSVKMPDVAFFIEVSGGDRRGKRGGSISP